mmetsp:Transcript_9056/g.19633  ORF Transcript_9056/g.19633 Transcript_9056/m.19633 type:complete len:254 (-) Transcript_9056:181-942(-)
MGRALVPALAARRARHVLLAPRARRRALARLPARLRSRPRRIHPRPARRHLRRRHLLRHRHVRRGVPRRLRNRARPVAADATVHERLGAAQTRRSQLERVRALPARPLCRRARLRHATVQRMLGRMVQEPQETHAHWVLPHRRTTRDEHERWRRHHLPAHRRDALRLGRRPDCAGESALWPGIHLCLSRLSAAAASGADPGCYRRVALSALGAFGDLPAARLVAYYRGARAWPQGADPLHGALHRRVFAPHRP